MLQAASLSAEEGRGHISLSISNDNFIEKKPQGHGIGRLCGKEPTEGVHISRVRWFLHFYRLYIAWNRYV